MRVLQDTDKMPWGQYTGRPMSDIPADYFHFFWTKKGFKDNKLDPVADYIRRNLGALKKEYPDGIWS